MRVLSFSISVPEDGIAHAGGEYYLRHVRALLSSGHSVTIVAPRTADNVAAARRRSVPASVLLIAPRRQWLRPVDIIVERFRPALPSRGLLRGARVSARLRDLIIDADTVEFQWTQTGGLQQVVDRVARRPTLLVAHDVMTQSLHRDAVQPGVAPFRRALRWCKYWLTRRDERRVISGKDRVASFSGKDALLIGTLVPEVESRVLTPPLEPDASDWSTHRPPSDGAVLFVGAFDRNENAEAAVWFIEQVWPGVRSAAPAARLVLAGGGPTESMRTAARGDESIVMTGYVRDLDQHYRAASVVVVPLQNGAGVKFKTVTAMMWGIPVVTTSVGAEGIATQEDDVFVVSDDAVAFARGVADVLLFPDRYDRSRQRARELVLRAFGNSRFERELEDLLR